MLSISPLWREAPIVKAYFAGQQEAGSQEREEEVADTEGQKVDLEREQFPNSIRLDDFETYDVLIVGAGLSGTVLADLYARKHNKKVLMLERRPHIGGNCFDFAEKRTGILMNLYGAHLFHTSKESVWKYMHRFSKWTPYEHRVVGRVDGKLVPIPVNIDTARLLFKDKMHSIDEMQAWLQNERQAQTDHEAKNSRDVGIGRVGKRLYEKLFREYTKKQWGVFPEDLGPEVLARIPVRTDWDDRYFPNDPFQALPANGYTKWFEEALNHPNIKVYTSVDYFGLMATSRKFREKSFQRTFFTGQIDQFFIHKGVNLEPLQYRSINFDARVVHEPAVFQPAFVVNNPQLANGDFTRTVEYKHMYMQSASETILVREFSTSVKEGQEPYYPFPTDANKAQFENYRKLAEREEAENNVFFVGRLANYKYFNMDDAVENALKLYERLEGDYLLNQAIAEGEERLEPTDLPVVHIVVFLEHATEGEDLSWLVRFCDRAHASEPRYSVKIFLYNSSPSLDTVLLDKITQAFSAQGSPEPRILGQNIFVYNLGHSLMELAWLEHLTRNSFAFGDMNLFIRASSAKVHEEAIFASLQTQRELLFNDKLTQASHPAVRTTDIRSLHANSLQEYLKRLASSLRSSLSVEPVASNALHAFHLLPLSRNFVDVARTSVQEDLKSLAEVVPVHEFDFSSCPVVFRTLEFSATDASLRRMLAIHRTVFHDHILPALRTDSSISQLVSFIRKAWFCFFFDEV